MSHTPAHSPLPWNISLLEDEDYEVETTDRNPIFISEHYKSFPPHIDDAKFIVEACNSHYELKAINKELLEALKEAHKYVNNDITNIAKQYKDGGMLSISDSKKLDKASALDKKIEAAIAKAEGK